MTSFLIFLFTFSATAALACGDLDDKIILNDASFSASKIKIIRDRSRKKENKFHHDIKIDDDAFFYDHQIKCWKLDSQAKTEGANQEIDVKKCLKDLLLGSPIKITAPENDNVVTGHLLYDDELKKLYLYSINENKEKDPYRPFLIFEEKEVDVTSGFTFEKGKGGNLYVQAFDKEKIVGAHMSEQTPFTPALRGGSPFAGKTNPINGTTSVSNGFCNREVKEEPYVNSTLSASPSASGTTN
ncbi:MAG: hypothetical protein SGJ18_01110 [Pseudomonadota bacterium]|nr:hypothetical protein [Pseudomonadota bacterium]